MYDYTNTNDEHNANDSDNILDNLQRLGLPDDAPPPNPHINFTLRGKVLEYPGFASAVRRLAKAHGRFRKTRAAHGLAFVGQSGSGKTTVIDYYARNFPFREHETGRHMPVVKVLTPESPTVKTLAHAFLDAMAVPDLAKGSAQDMTNRFIEYVRRCGVEMLIIDEFQHFLEGGRDTKKARSVSDWLKNLLSECQVVVVLVGLPKSILALNINEQLRRRFGAAHEMKPFGYVTAHEQRDFQDLLANLQTCLPCPCVALDTPEIAGRFYFGSMGLIDYVIKILDGAVSAGGSGPSGKLVLGDFAQAFREEVWNACPDALNPFVPGATLRPLRQRNEPFEGWDDIEQYTLSRAAAKVAGQQTSGGKTNV